MLFVNREIKISPHSGFTLLELLMVLFLFSAVGGLVLPRLSLIYESFQTSLQRDEALNQIADLGLLAMKRGKGGKIQADSHVEKDFEFKEDRDNVLESLPLELPKGWAIATEKDIVYHDSGVCMGGLLSLSGPSASFLVELRKPLCQPIILD